jgi:hypothetical protein
MILDYASLQTAIADWLNRTDLTARIPTFIQLTEAEMRRRLEYTTTRAAFAITAESTPLPADCKSLRSVWLSDGNAPAENWPLTIVTPDVLAERRQDYGAQVGRPRFASVIDNVLAVVPAPTAIAYPEGVLLTEDSEPLETEDSEGSPAVYNAEIVYYNRLTPLSNTATTNEILSIAPDAYLYGALMQASPFLEHDERLPVWEQKFEKAMQQLILDKDHEEYGAGIKQMRLPRVF